MDDKIFPSCETIADLIVDNFVTRRQTAPRAQKNDSIYKNELVISRGQSLPNEVLIAKDCKEQLGKKTIAKIDADVRSPQLLSLLLVKCKGP